MIEKELRKLKKAVKELTKEVKALKARPYGYWYPYYPYTTYIGTAVKSLINEQSTTDGTVSTGTIRYALDPKDTVYF